MTTLDFNLPIFLIVSTDTPSLKRSELQPMQKECMLYRSTCRLSSCRANLSMFLMWIGVTRDRSAKTKNCSMTNTAAGLTAMKFWSSLNGQNLLTCEDLLIGVDAILILCGFTVLSWVLDEFRMNRILFLLTQMWTFLARTMWGPCPSFPTCSKP